MVKEIKHPKTDGQWKQELGRVAELVRQKGTKPTPFPTKLETKGRHQKWKRHAMEGMTGNKPYSRMTREPSGSSSASAKNGFRLLYAL